MKINFSKMFSSQSWIEGEAVRQLELTQRLPGMLHIVGLPDLHPGKSTPIGAAYFSKGWVYPRLIGEDIGCGTGFFETDLSATKVKRDKWAGKLSRLNQPDKSEEVYLNYYRQLPVEHPHTFGTLGGGNHFIELQKLEHVECQESLKRLELRENRLYLLVHSGSRSLGATIYKQHLQTSRSGGLIEGSPAAMAYLADHDTAIEWARCNREVVARRFCKQIGARAQMIFDHPHNWLQPISIAGNNGFLHRKGATPSDRGVLVIPGSRGTLSYLVEPVGNQQGNLWSLAHGAGRKWSRKSCRERLSRRLSVNRLRVTDLGSRVICDDRDLLFEEAPQAYKPIDTIINELKALGLIRIVATLRPIITYKRREEK